MPTFEIEQYELHTTKYRVEAASEADAIVKLLNGKAEPVEQSQDFIEVADAYGMATKEYQELARVLRKLGVKVGTVIPSIRGVEKIEDD
jgi:hypothetical protein